MALPISLTPVMRGKDSKRFNAQLKKNSKSTNSREERKKGIALVQAVLKSSVLKYQS